MNDDISNLSQENLDALLSGTEPTKENGTKGTTLNTPQSNLELGKSQAGMGLDQDSLNALVGSLDTTSQEQKADISDLGALSAPGSDSAEKEDNIEFLKDVTLRFTVELGRTKMLIKEVLKLGENSIVELDKDVDEDVDILVNDHVFGRGRLKLIGEYFGVQITHVEDSMQQYRSTAS